MNTATHYTASEVTLLVFAMQSAHATGGRTRDDLVDALHGYIASRTRMIKATQKMLRPSSIAMYPTADRAARVANVEEQIEGRQVQQRRARRVLKKMGAGK